ncbi:esterase-like activity of phytase family protein [Kiloniella laminariae]|uniref:Esterase-like activity of phytase family protein n=1 Tax=Kiloniella laminariae TaxID=454162 RepID=A0ABT4LN15_9PROT|nr:esterase-like activity of phytase family protein [Kiloniella laminariae]MCZ4282504.1 esterase-like activity of phytase family protein [Kiloniella laminariae]
MNYLAKSASLAVIALCMASPSLAVEGFSRLSSLPVYKNLPKGNELVTETGAEIITSAMNGTMLVYTDSALEAIGKVNIFDPASPKAAGVIMVGGEPTSVTVKGNYAYTGVNTSKSYKEPSGYLAVIDLTTDKIAAKCDVAGQPDSVALSPDGKYLAVAVENERDEELNDGLLPQGPAGHLATFAVSDEGNLSNCKAVTITDLTGLAEIAPSDPEPEFVSINSKNQAVITLQENNHIALVDLENNKIIRHFSAGTSTVSGVDSSKDKSISLTDDLTDIRREPDAVSWIDDNRFVTANEGDYKGGSRGFTVFSTAGDVLYDSGALTEELAVSMGQYPEKRSHKKGTEPEGVTVGTFGKDRLVFVGLERANLVGVFHDVETSGMPNNRLDLVQGLPSGGVGPEGIVAIPERGLLVIANEKDNAEDGYRSNVTIYKQGNEGAVLPQIVSVDGPDGKPIGWGALSGLTANPSDPSILYAVNDSFYSTADIFTLDVSASPARIVTARRLTKDGKPMENLDLEGIAAAEDGSFWVVSEAKPEKRQSQLLHVLPTGQVIKEIALPEAVEAQMLKHGLEGVALADDQLYIAVQREWKDDPKGYSKILSYDINKNIWGVLAYRLDKPESPAGGWVGLSEITSLGNGELAIVERDNKGGEDAAIKRLYRVSVRHTKPVPVGTKEIPVLEKELIRDLLVDMKTSKGWTPDKIEGLTVAADGTVYAVTDNDGVDDSNGETLFMNLGPVNKVLAQN